MVKIQIKALSLNEAYRGRRFKTKELEAYHNFVEYSLLTHDMNIPKGKLSVRYEFGVSSKGSDGDNLIKCFQDSLARRYKFNDNRIYQWEVEKVDVKKGEEYIGFEICAAEKTKK